MANLSIRNLQKGFDGHAIIKGIDLDIRDREFVVCVGPSGCEVTLDARATINLPLAGASLSVGSPVTLGSDTYCHVHTSSGEALTLRIRGDLASQYGKTLNLHLGSTHCHLFDAQGLVITSALQAAA